MGLLNFFKPKADKSKYENLPLIDPQEDKKVPGGYVARKFITEEKLYISCDNIFRGSNIPIVAACNNATKYVQTTVLQNKDHSKVRSVLEIIFFSIPQSLQRQYIDLVLPLNKLIKQHDIPDKYLINLNNVKFISSDTNSSFPLSRIEFDQDKNEFHFIYCIEYVQRSFSKEFDKYSTPVFNSEEIGRIIYDENGIIKKAYFFQDGAGKYRSKISFKNYKTGLDLYDIRSAGDIIYKRKSS